MCRRGCRRNGSALGRFGVEETGPRRPFLSRALTADTPTRPNADPPTRFSCRPAPTRFSSNPGGFRVYWTRMRISRRAEYALRALLLIAKNQKVKVHQIQELSERGNIPVKFLEQILLHLRNEGLLTSKRGVGGGYSLRKRASDIAVLDIVELIDGPIAPLPCALERPSEPCGCPDPTRCPLRPLMRQTREMVRELFSSKTVQDLLDDSRGEQVLAFEI
jgi:Rrf2 family protein